MWLHQNTDCEPEWDITNVPQETAPYSNPMPVSACKAPPGEEHSGTLRTDSSYFHISFTPVIQRP